MESGSHYSYQKSFSNLEPPRSCGVEADMIESPPPVLEQFCPLFVQIAQMGLILPRIPPQTPFLSQPSQTKYVRAVRGMSLEKVSYEAFVFSVFSRNQE